MGCNSDICNLEVLIRIMISPSLTVMTKKPQLVVVGQIIDRSKELSYDVPFSFDFPLI